MAWIALLAFLTIPLAMLGFFSFPPSDSLHNGYRTELTPRATEPLPEFTIRGVAFSVEIADTPARQAQGLSGRPTLGDREGLLFVFPQAGLYNFWMKDMLFPLDLIWIGDDRRIVDITEDARPESFPKTFTSRVPARYVLEVPAGTVQRENFMIGDPVGGTLLLGR